MAKQLDHHKDKQKVLKSKLASQEDKIENLKRQMEANDERHAKQTRHIKKKEFELDEMKLAIEDFQKSVKNLSTNNRRLEAAN